MVTGSNPVRPTNEYKSQEIPLDFLKKSQVLPEAKELLQFRELLFILLGNKGRRQLELRQKTNNELFALYEGELAFHHRSAKGIHEAKRVIGHFHDYLGEYPPTPELAKSFLSQFKDRKPTTLSRYTAILKVFFKWYGEDLDINIRVPKILPSYVEKADVEKLLEALKSKKSHKKTIDRDILLVDLAIHTGLRRSELANLKVGDIDLERQVLIVRQGKGSKDRVIPLSMNTIEKLNKYIKNKDKTQSLFGLVPASISGKIRFFSEKAGVNLHTHSLRDYFATSLSEKGATIREIQSLLGHSNLVHTERYTLHTDKHLKDAINLIDQDKNETTTDKQNVVLAKSELQPIVVIKAVCKPSVKNPNSITSEPHSHFIAYNDGNSPAIEVEIALFDNDLKLFEANRNTVLRVKEEMEFNPNLRFLYEGKYLIICKYKDANSKSINQTCLPFSLGKANMTDEVYIAPRELQFEFNLSEKEQIQIFSKITK